MNDDICMMVLKEALDFNARIIGLATVFAGHCSGCKETELFKKYYKEEVKKYNKNIDLILEESNEKNE